MYVLLTRLLGTLLAGLTFAVAKIAQRCGVIADWCLRKLTWLLNELQAWLKRTAILMIDWLDHAIMRVLRTLWLLESAFARSAARGLHLCYLCVRLGLFYAPTVACVVAYWWLGSAVWLAVGVCWGVLITSLLVSFLFSPQKNTTAIELPNLQWLERIFRYVFRLGPLFTIAVCCLDFPSYSFSAQPFLILIGVGWLGVALVFGQLTNVPNPQFASLTEFIAAVTHSQTMDLDPKNSFTSQAMLGLSKAIELEPKNASLYRKRGLAYRRERKRNEAIADLSKAIELEPKSAWAYCERGITYRLFGKFDEAIVDLSKAIEIDPKSSSGYCQRGIAYRLQNKFREAIDDLDKAIELDPKDAWTYRERELVYRLQGKFNAAASPSG
ncbi:MAG: tetratricopeptide repeat protein [Planctomycetaceae bacterium]|nr:tetratricopeptide repeat protein [Planctomycetaceae bacterium]